MVNKMKIFFLLNKRKMEDAKEWAAKILEIFNSQEEDTALVKDTIPIQRLALYSCIENLPPSKQVLVEKSNLLPLNLPEVLKIEVITFLGGDQIVFKKFTDRKCVRYCKAHKARVTLSWSPNPFYLPEECGRWNQPYKYTKICPRKGEKTSYKLEEEDDMNFYDRYEGGCIFRKGMQKVRMIALFKNDKYKNFTTEDWRKHFGNSEGIKVE
jgi:hypothetical protein